MKEHLLDIDGRDLKLGDWVRVIGVPLSIQGMPQETLDAFSKAVGLTFQIEEILDDNSLCLDLDSKINEGSIFIEPYCVRRFRRYKRFSQKFQRQLNGLAEVPPPQLEIKFELILKSEEALDDFDYEIIEKGFKNEFEFWFSIWPKERKVAGSIVVEESNPRAKTILEEAKKEMQKNDQLISSTFSEIKKREPLY